MSLTVSVVGLGKVGLPLAVQYATHGAHVIGCDINPHVVAEVNAGRTPIADEADLQNRLSQAHANGTIEATADTKEAVTRSDVVVIIVPLMVDADRNIDFTFIDSATEAVGSGLKPGTLVVYETTLPVGTTRDRNAKTLERVSGMTAGEDFFVAFSPERIRTGQIFRDLATYPKVVGGLGPKDTKVAVDFYSTVLSAEIMEVSNSEAAELTKLIETTYRDINIAMANEFAMFAGSRGLDIFEAIDAANSQPQSHIHQPGIGVGGHCIPVYPYFMINNANDNEVRLARLSRDINDAIPAEVSDVLSDQLAEIEQKRAVVVGLAYRANVKESAFSVAFNVVRALEDAGFKVEIFDPLFSDEEIQARGLTPASSDVDDYPVVAVQALHDSLSERKTAGFPHAKIIIDGRNDLNESAIQPGQTHFVVGKPITAMPSEDVAS